ncbi:MAG TPA: homoserine dehydrogenase [Fimbriimonadaceae bacterium]|nr:homoserine dehydrogenase [Fimbriimonadaceae bacterium]
MSNPRLTVLKFGGSVLGTEKDLPRAVSEVYRWVRAGHKVVVVASAFYGTTDRLESRAKGWGIEQNPHAAAEMIATGELASCSELTLALGRAGITAQYLSPRVVNLLSVGDAMDSDPISLKVDLIESALSESDVVVIPGFVACDAAGATNLLGRGGSDLSALFIAYRLRAGNCRLLKDTDGLYEWDPKKPGPKPKGFAEITWDRAMQLEKRVLQPKALAFAKQQNMAFSFACIGNEEFTLVGGIEDRFRAEAQPPKPLKVALFGLGTVGRGVFERLSELLDRFEVVAVVARDPSKHRDVPNVTSDVAQSLNSDFDVAVEVIGGTETARTIVETSLHRGLQVVTANKDLIATFGQDYDLTRVRYGAAVGGAVPMLERVQLLASRGITSLRGVVNGTTNYVIDRVLAGEAYDDVVNDAIRLGYAESDPSKDIEGWDAAYKLVILGRAAFGISFTMDDVRPVGISSVNWTEAREKLKQGQRLRLVVTATPNGLSVEPVFLPESDLLAQTRMAANALKVSLADGTSEVIRGLGAGRYPTTEAVMGDLLELSRLTQSPDLQPLKTR